MPAYKKIIVIGVISAIKAEEVSPLASRVYNSFKIAKPLSPAYKSVS